MKKLINRFWAWLEANVLPEADHVERIRVRGTYDGLE
jgi:hypothetical protein